MICKKILLVLLFVLLLYGFPDKNVYGSNREEVQMVTDHLDYQLFLPLIPQPDQFDRQATSIWSHSSHPISAEVTLFRKNFVIATSVDAPTLSIFADTRYEVWIDGQWIGRGPARFLEDFREYDQFLLDNLTPGEHLIAILVEWSPNNRRSESTTPNVKSLLHGKAENSNYLLVSTDTSWKAFRSPAWQMDATLVHTWGLIGTTELLDLRELPKNWMLLEFSDDDWEFAVEIDPTRINFQQSSVFFETVGNTPLILQKQNLSTIGKGDPDTVTYTTRSIQMVDQNEKDFVLIDHGLLSPGRIITELLPSSSDPYDIHFGTEKELHFEIEMLIAESIPTPEMILLDDFELSWVPVGGDRVDVYKASADLLPGTHNLRLIGIPPHGVTLSLPSEHIVWNSTPFSQGSHAGRRMLLPTYVSDSNAIGQTSNVTETITLSDLPSYLILDLGRTVHGRLEMTVKGPSGSIIDIGWDERLFGNPPRPLPFPGSLHPQWNQVDSWILDGNQRDISTIDSRAGRYILIAAWGHGPIILENIRIFEEHYPVVKSGWFVSENDLLNQIWQIGADSTLVNMTDAYADPWRERGQWWGDAYVIDHANRVAFGNMDLLRRGVQFMARAFDEGRPVGLSPNGEGAHLHDYGMLWLHSLQEYLALSGDEITVKELYPTVIDFMSYLELYINPITGLLDLPVGHWTDNSYIDTNGWENRYGQSTAVNSIYYQTLLRSAEMASELGDETRAIAWKADANKIKEGLKSELYLIDENRYITKIYNDEITPPTAYSQAWPLAYSVVSPDKIDVVVSALLELLSKDPENPTINVYGMYWVLEALGKSGYISEAIDLIEIFYGYMVSRGATTWWERFDADQVQWASLSHGWGSSPTWFLTTYVLGVKQVDETSWIVQPPFEGVTKASGGIPINGNVLDVYWDQFLCQDQTIQVNAPKNTTGQVIISMESLEQILLDGELIWEDGGSNISDVWTINNNVHVQLGEGVSSFHLHRTCK